MQRIKIDEAREGMKLAKPVMSEQGTVLCREGTDLSEGMIEVLKKRGVIKLRVEGHPVERPDEVPLEKRLEGVRLRFSKAEESLYAMKLRNIIIRNIKAEYAEEDNG